MSNNVRIAIRSNATPLSRAEIERVTGGGSAGENSDSNGTSTNSGMQCDPPTDSWVTGGDFVRNDD